MTKNVKARLDLLKHLPLILEHAAIDSIDAAYTWGEHGEPLRSMGKAFAAMIDGTSDADEAVRIAIHNANRYKALVDWEIECYDLLHAQNSMVDHGKREFTLKQGVTLEQYRAAGQRYRDLKDNPPAGAYIITGKDQAE